MGPKKHYQMILDNLSEVVYIRDLNQNIIYINSAFEKITGIPIKEVLGKKCFQVFGDETQSCTGLCPAEEVIKQNQQVLYHERELKTRSGETRLMKVSISPLYEKDEITGAVVMMNDITHLKKMEQTGIKSRNDLEKEIEQRRAIEKELKELNKSLVQERQIFISGTAVVFKWQNREGWPVEYVSPNVESVLGYKVRELLSGKVPYADIIPEKDIQRNRFKYKRHVWRGNLLFTIQASACWETYN